MKMNELIHQINGQENILTLINEKTDKEISGVYIGDLLSHVMANADENNLWLTVQRHVNVIAVAQLLDFSGIIFVEGVKPEEDTLKKATELDIPLLTTPLDAYSLSIKFSQIGL